MRFELTFDTTSDGRDRVMIYDVSAQRWASIVGPMTGPMTEQGTFRPKALRRAALESFIHSVGYELSRRLFPEDTVVYDVQETNHGTFLTNPHYPGDNQ